MIGYIDCRIEEDLDNEYLTLNLWGRPLFAYVVDEVLHLQNVTKVVILTNSKYVIYLGEKLFKNKVQFSDRIQDNYPLLIVSGRAPFLKATTLENAIEYFKEERGILYSSKQQIEYDLNSSENNVRLIKEEKNSFVFAFVLINSADESTKRNSYLLNSTESIVVNSKKDFETAIVYKKKEINKLILKKKILNRIQEKRNILRKSVRKGICLIGHSQIDNWKIKEIPGGV